MKGESGRRAASMRQLERQEQIPRAIRSAELSNCLLSSRSRHIPRVFLLVT